MRVTEGRNSLKTRGEGKVEWHISLCLPITLVNLKRQEISWVCGDDHENGDYGEASEGGDATVETNLPSHSLSTDVLSLNLSLTPCLFIFLLHTGVKMTYSGVATLMWSCPVFCFLFFYARLTEIKSFFFFFSLYLSILLIWAFTVFSLQPN